MWSSASCRTKLWLEFRLAARRVLNPAWEDGGVKQSAKIVTKAILSLFSIRRVCSAGD